MFELITFEGLGPSIILREYKYEQELPLLYWLTLCLHRKNAVVFWAVTITDMFMLYDIVS